MRRNVSLLNSTARAPHLVIAALAIFLTATEARAACKWFKVCGYEPGASAAVLGGVPDCITLNSSESQVGGDGCVRFELCAVALLCADCPATVNIEIDVGGASDPFPTVVEFVCATCGVFPQFTAFPTEPDCVPDICSAGGDDSPGALNVSACALFDCNGDGLPDGHFGDQLDKLGAGDGAESDHFGDFVAISGITAIVGAPLHDHNGDDSGSAYIFRNDGDGNWLEIDEITATDAEAGDFFGFRVGLSADTAVVSAYGDDDKAENSGAAYIFREVDGVWTQIANPDIA